MSTWPLWAQPCFHSLSGEISILWGTIRAALVHKPFIQSLLFLSRIYWISTWQGLQASQHTRVGGALPVLITCKCSWCLKTESLEGKQLFRYFYAGIYFFHFLSWTFSRCRALCLQNQKPSWWVHCDLWQLWLLWLEQACLPGVIQTVLAT